MTRASYEEPLTAFNFFVQIHGLGGAGFFSVTPPAVSVIEKEYHEGGNNISPHLSVDSVKYDPIILRRGSSVNNDFATWMGLLAAEQTGYGRVTNMWGKFKGTLSGVATGLIEDGADYVGQQIPGLGGLIGGVTDATVGEWFRRNFGPDGRNYRKTVTITQVDRSGIPVKAWRLYNCFPIKYRISEELDANQSILSIESLELVYEGFELVREINIKNALEQGLTDGIDELFGAIGI